MTTQTFTVNVGDKAISASRDLPTARGPGWTFIYAPGAGSSIGDPFGEYLSGRLPAARMALIRFQFPYMEDGKRRPDQPALLEETWRAVISQAGPFGGRVAIGGRSMGGRIASSLAAQGTAVDALALFAYPLHPPSNPARVRDEHLSAIAAPTLFCSGTRDTFATPAELTAAAMKVGTSKVHVLEGADHGFATTIASGRSREEVWVEATDVLLSWLDSL